MEFPHFKKFTLLDESKQSITSTNTNMESLEEKFKEAIRSQTHVVTLQNENLAVSGINKASEQCVEIAEEFAVEVVVFLNNISKKNAILIVKDYIKNEQHLKDNG